MFQRVSHGIATTISFQKLSQNKKNFMKEVRKLRLMVTSLNTPAHSTRLVKPMAMGKQNLANTRKMVVANRAVAFATSIANINSRMKGPLSTTNLKELARILMEVDTSILGSGRRIRSSGNKL